MNNIYTDVEINLIKKWVNKSDKIRILILTQTTYENKQIYYFYGREHTQTCLLNYKKIK